MTASERFFQFITRKPWFVIAISVVIFGALGYGLKDLVKDTSVKAFIPPGHATLEAEKIAREVFGISDTIAVAVVNRDGSSIFKPDTLKLIARISDALSLLPNIDPDRISSLATESSIAGDGSAVYIDPYIDEFNLDNTSAQDAEQRWQKMAVHQGTIVSYDGSAAVIMAEIVDLKKADQTYDAILAYVAGLDTEGVDIHVAGPGAISGYLSEYIDRDARKLQPVALLVVVCFIFLAFRRAAALPGPLFIIVGAAAASIGIMASNHIPYYAITSALPVIIVAISVADALHVLSAYYQNRAMDTQSSVRDIVVRAMVSTARPVTLTTLTTIAGFAGIVAMSVMPPIRYFALYAGVGVALAWVLSIVVLPNLLVVLNLGESPAFASWRENKPSNIGRLLGGIAAASRKRWPLVLLAFAVVVGISTVGALQLRIDRSQVENFTKDEPVRIADELINQRFAGTSFLDVIVETDESDGLLRADRMQKIADLQHFFEQLPHVQKTASIVDYISELHKAIEGEHTNAQSQRPLPDTDQAIAEYLFVYEVSGDPEDLEDEIDDENRIAFIRGALNSHYFSDSRVVVDALEHYIATTFNEPGMTALLSGGVNTSYHWMSSLESTHFKGIVFSLLLVLAAAILLFQSVIAGVVATAPVVLSILVIYAWMGYMGLYLEPATSMFAAIALGLGVDYAIHILDRLLSAVKQADGDIGAAIDCTLAPVARACFFNAVALGLGFGVLFISELPTLTRFGGMVALAAFSSFIFSLVLSPAMFYACYKVMGVRFLVASRRQTVVGLLLAGGAAMMASLWSEPVSAEETRAYEIAASIAARPQAPAAKYQVEMEITNKRDHRETRVAVFHKSNGAELEKTRITFLEPKKSKDVTFLSYDYRSPQEDDERWMFTPATKRVRRIPASDRGKAFLGTDFSYEDIQSELKFELSDWHFDYLGETSANGQRLHRLAGKPQSIEIARELGYSQFEASVDETSWMPVKIDFLDLSGRPLKTIELHQVEKIEGIWTALDITAKNHQRDHHTRFVFQDIEYLQSLPELIFDAKTLNRELPRSLMD